MATCRVAFCQHAWTAAETMRPTQRTIAYLNNLNMLHMLRSDSAQLHQSLPRPMKARPQTKRIKGGTTARFHGSTTLDSCEPCHDEQTGDVDQATPVPR